MRIHLALAMAVALAALLPTSAAAAASVPAQPAASLASDSMWGMGDGAAPDCQTVTTPLRVPAGEAPVLVGAPGEGLLQWCGAFALVLPDGAALLPGGIAGEWLTATQAAAQMGTAVTVVIGPSGRVTVYLSA